MEKSLIQNIRIGDVLLELGYVSDEQIKQAMAYRETNKGMRTGDALIELGFITEDQMLTALASRLGIELVNISDIAVDISAVQMIPEALAEKYCMMGYKARDGVYYLLVNDPMNLYAIEDIRQIVGMDIEISLCTKSSLESAIGYYYSEVSAKEAADKAAAQTSARDVLELDLENADDDTPIINLFNSLLQRALNAEASDIHIEPLEKETHVRMRLDGVMIDFMTLQKNIHNSLVARIKILGDLDIAERRLPQDGHFKTVIEGRSLNVRVSVIPTVYGEKAVLRLLSSTAHIDNPATYGMNDRTYASVKEMLRSPNGIIYVTGPTGSGKSTTLYMILESLVAGKINISTIEDPVEKIIPGLNQMQVNNQAGLTFERGLRALLRQDPDVIMVGETRDKETATISVRAAITGHQVFSTLHTNDAVSSIVRLSDMGVEKFMIANSIVGVIAQRLMRKVCPYCASTGEMTDEEIVLAGKRIRYVKHAVGCKKCNNTGYIGRVAVHETFLMDKKIREMVMNGESVDVIKDYVVNEKGMVTLKKAALELVEAGVTTVEEMAKVAYYE